MIPDSLSESAPPAATSVSSLIFQPASYVDRLRLDELFPQAQPFEVELGAGDGTFLASYAKAHPGRNFLGVERLLGRLRKLDRKGQRAGLDNLRLLRLEASYLLAYLLPLESVQALHIYFPDPWPKRRHRKNRLINREFTLAAAKVLRGRGVVYLRTDDADYFAQMTEVFSANPLFRPTEGEESLGEFLTDFERAFRARGIQTLRAAFERKPH